MLTLQWFRLVDCPLVVFHCSNQVANVYRTAFDECSNPDLGEPVLSRDIKLQCFRDGGQIYAKVAGGCKRTTIFSCSHDYECRKTTNDPLGIECTGDCVCDTNGINTCTCVKQLDSVSYWL